jgi:glycosyltransferase involved in cell wall biosynthesis
MQIACYYPWIYLRGGIERTIIETVTRSRHHWDIFTNHYDRENTFPEFADLNVHELARITVKRDPMSVMKAATQILFQRLPLDKYDALLIHSEGLGDLITFLNSSKPIFCYCHLPLLVANDQTVKDKYNQRSPGKAWLLNIGGSAFRTLDRAAWTKYRHVFVTSNTVKANVLGTGLATEDQVDMVRPGVDCAALTPTYVYGNYFLAFSRLKWWKNVDLAVRAFRQYLNMGGRCSGFKLIVAGQVDEGSQAYFIELVALAGGELQIEFVPNPNAEQVKVLMRSAYAVLNTTLNEPWGIVPLEANAYGKAVIAVDYGGTRESQVHGSTGLLVPGDPVSFACAIEALAADRALTVRMGANARENALKYDWRGAVEALDDSLERLAPAKPVGVGSPLIPVHEETVDGSLGLTP